MKKLNVAVLLGGPSAEREVSQRSGQAVAQALRDANANVTEIDVHGPDFALPPDTDVAFIALHGTFGEDGTVQRILEQRGIAYTGSGPEASELAFDKLAAKAAFKRSRIPTPAYAVWEVGKSVGEQIVFLGNPLVVKPVRQGSSVGVSIVNDSKSLEAACRQALEHDSQVLIEKFILGRELTVGIFDGRPLPVIEVRPKTTFFDYTAKYTAGQTEYIVPAELPQLDLARAQHLALNAHDCLGCRDLSRVDIMLSTKGEMFVLEVNTIPGFTETSLVPKAARAMGMEFKTLCVRLVEMALKRRAEIKSAHAITTETTAQ